MHPKPIFWCDTNLLLDHLVYCPRSVRNGSTWLVEPLGEHHSPARWTGCVNSSSDERRVGPLCKQTRQRRSGRESSEKRRPNSMVASVLVGQNADAATRAQQVDHRLKSDLAVEQFQASLAARPAHMLVNETVAELLINARVSHEANKPGHQLREQFPCPEMTQNEDDGNARAKFAGHRFDIFDLNPAENLLRRHCGEFCAAEQVSAKPLKVPAY